MVSWFLTFLLGIFNLHSNKNQIGNTVIFNSALLSVSFNLPGLVGLLLAVAREPVWFRRRLSWVDGRPEADHERVLYPERLCSWWYCCGGGGGSGDGWLIAVFWPENELSLIGLTGGAFCEVNICCPYGSISKCLKCKFSGPTLDLLNAGDGTQQLALWLFWRTGKSENHCFE